MKTVAIVSGGMDSTVMLYMLKEHGDEILAVSFDYGQRHRKEIAYAEATCRKLWVPHSVVDIHDVSYLLSGSGSALVSSSEVPEGHYEDETMKQTVVPNRNMIMLSIAIGYAVAEKYYRVAVGVHTGDHAVYPDCRPKFISALNFLVPIACEGFVEADFHVYAPFIHKTKTEIARRGGELHVPFKETWSCYKGGEVHCGRCSTCVERLEALNEANVFDGTTYEDATFWREAVGIK